MENRWMKLSTGTIAILMGLLMSCKPYGNNENSRLMQQAQLLVEQMPDSALMLLDAVNTATFSDAERAEYTLLMVQAKDKTDQDIIADTVIFSIRDYFIAAKNDEKAALSCYYAGRVLEEQGNAKAAMQAYLEAAGIAQSLKNHERLKGLIESHTGKLYYERLETTEAIVHYRKAAEHFRLADDHVKEMYTWNAIGGSHLLKKSFDSALYYFNKVTEMPAYHNHQIMQASILRNTGIISRYAGNPQNARDLFLQALKRNADEQMKPYLYICLSQAYHGLQRPDSASFYINRAIKLCEQIPNPPMASIYKTLTQMEESRGNEREALKYAYKHIEYLQNTYAKYLDQQLTEAEKKYNLEVERNKNNQLTIQRNNELILFLCILTGLLVAAIIFLIISRSRKKTINQKNSDINRLTHQANDQKQTIDTLTHQTDEHKQQLTILKEQIERDQKIIQQAEEHKRQLTILKEQIERDQKIIQQAEEHKRQIAILMEQIKQNLEIIQQLGNEKKAGNNKENNSEIDVKIKEREEFVEQLENKLRLSYTYRLKAHLEIRKDYDNFKRMNKHNMNFQLMDKFFYGNSDKLSWETIIPLMPDKFEEKIKMNYNKLNENEIKLWCLLLFDVDKFDWIRLLSSYKKESISAIKHRIKEKTGTNDIIKALMPLLH